MSASIHHMGTTAGGLNAHVRPVPLPAAEKALRAARAVGFDEGERYGYITGWRWGVLCGACVALPAGMGLMWAMVQLGTLLGRGA